MYKTIREFLRDYVQEGAEDKHAIGHFCDCENRERINALKTELTGLVQKPLPDELLDKVIGLKRRIKHGSYVEWAKIMLIWLAEKSK